MLQERTSTHPPSFKNSRSPPRFTGYRRKETDSSKPLHAQEQHYTVSCLTPWSTKYFLLGRALGFPVLWETHIMGTERQ